MQRSNRLPNCIGWNWWRYDSNLTLRADRVEAENRELRERLEAIENVVKGLGGVTDAAPAKTPAAGRSKAAGVAGKARSRRPRS